MLRREGIYISTGKDENGVFVWKLTGCASPKRASYIVMFEVECKFVTLHFKRTDKCVLRMFLTNIFTTLVPLALERIAENTLII
jgi:hypothetical protein